MKFIRTIIFMVLSLNIKSHASLIDQLPSMSPQEMQEKFTPVVQYLHSKNDEFQQQYDFHSNNISFKTFRIDQFREECLEKKRQLDIDCLKSIEKYNIHLNPESYLFTETDYGFFYKITTYQTVQGANRKYLWFDNGLGNTIVRLEQSEIVNLRKISLITNIYENLNNKYMTILDKSIAQANKEHDGGILYLKNIKKNYELHLLEELQSTLIPAYLKINNLETLTIKSVSALNEKDISIKPIDLFVEGSTVECLVDESQNKIKQTLAEINLKQPNHPILKLFGYQRQTN